MPIKEGDCMPRRHLALLSFLFFLASSAQGEEIKTTYNIGGSHALVTTKVLKASSETEKLLQSFLFPKLAEKLRAFPMVTGIEFNDAIKPETTSNEWADFWEHQRNYPVMVHLSLPTSITMMFKVEESYRTCKTVAEKESKATSPGYSDYDGGGTGQTVDCTRNSKVKITGPHSIYGNFASSLNIQDLLREKQNIEYTIERDWSDKANLKLDARFNIQSELFDQNLMKFLNALNVKPAGGESVASRVSILSGIARVLRVQNERMVEQ